MAKTIRSPALPSLFLLTPDYDKKGYCPWHSLGDVYQAKRDSQLRDTTALAKTWKKFSAKFEKERKQGDFMYGGGWYFATPNAFSTVKNFLGDAVEGLPVKVKGGSDLELVYLLHALVTAQISRDSEVALYSSGAIMRVQKYAFTRREIAGKHFFHSREGSATIVSGEFRALIEGAKLTGLGFVPLPGFSSYS